jgi:hypothetical protein
MLSGLETSQLLIGPTPKGDIVINQTKNLRKSTIPLIFDLFEYSQIFVEIPQIFRIEPNLLNNKNIGGEKICWEMSAMDFNKTLNSASSYINLSLKNNTFIYIHLKGGHTPYVYFDKNDYQDSPKNRLEKWYHKELALLTSSLKQFISHYKTVFDNVVITSDHGEMFINEDKTAGHVKVFNKTMINIPVWNNNKFPDKLYSGSQIYRMLLGKNPRSSDYVISSNPNKDIYHSLSISYLDKNKKLITEPFKTKSMWFLE